MSPDRAALDLMLVTDRSRVAAPGRSLADELDALETQIAAAVEAGVTHVQVRDRDVPAGALCAFVARVVARVGHRARVVVNDRLDVALGSGAAGVQLRSDGPPAARIRAAVPNGFLIGRSTHTLTEVRTHQDVDWLLFGPVFETPSHPGRQGQGVAALEAACAASRVPVFAIGGINKANLATCLDAGAAGIAAIRLFQSAV